MEAGEPGVTGQGWHGYCTRAVPSDAGFTLQRHPTTTPLTHTYTPPWVTLTQSRTPRRRTGFDPGSSRVGHYDTRSPVWYPSHMIATIPADRARASRRRNTKKQKRSWYLTTFLEGEGDAGTTPRCGHTRSWYLIMFWRERRTRVPLHPPWRDHAMLRAYTRERRVVDTHPSTTE